MPSVIALSGSPSTDSRTAHVADYALRRLSLSGHRTEHLAVRELPAAELLAGRAGSAPLRDALSAIADADGVIVATPVYKAAYTGLLKAFLDLLPQSGLAGKAVLPLATGGSLAHLLTLDYALRPVLSALGARHITAGTFVLDGAVERLPAGTGPGGLRARIEPEAELRLIQAVDGFEQALSPGGRFPDRAAHPGAPALRIAAG
ncbi:NADPH-dependent FMN reductase [Streptomyces lichenis]|uniref:NADPH-dependent FMN reductase n=1 Tax=Streptomyces lichenis TaxID=2306967 RepID=A0ABT0I443_9ACTN|nr:NADPH-dependent FMN reductase [Streptomyces lichenis]MCK8676083.1 NADPH-dependent FMN reductase [Streptomyces lichenis]